MITQPILMLDNINLWKDILDKDEDKICNGMTELERKVYQLGVQNLFNLFSPMINSNFEEGYYTVLFPDENIKPEEFALDDFYA